MILLQWFQKIKYTFKLLWLIILRVDFVNINYRNLKHQVMIVGPESLGVSIITACFIGIVFTLQVIKEFLYLDAVSFIGAILSLAFIRELSPVLIAVIISGRVGSSFTAELATMKVTEQIDALYLLNTDPIFYLVVPRLLACVLVLPCLNILFLLTSLSSSIFACYIFYNIHPFIFLHSSMAALSFIDFLKSTFKVIVFGIIISCVSCAWGLKTDGGSRSVGQSTTSSVVTSLLIIFIIDFFLTYILFNQTDSAIKSL